MKTRMNVGCLAAAIAVIAGLDSLASDGTWTNLAGGSWTAAANWSASAMAEGTGFTADFSTLDITSARTVTLDGARTIGKLIFADAANPDSDWTLGTGSSGPLTLAVSSGSPTVTVFNRTALISAVLAGSSGLTKAGAGTLVLSAGMNTYSGSTTIHAGQLVMGSAFSLISNTVMTVNAGGALDIHGYGVYSGPYWRSTFGALSIGGVGPDGNGALLNSTGTVAGVAAGTSSWSSGTGNQNATINLTADTLFNLGADFGQLNGAYATTFLNLNGYTLTKEGAGNYNLCNTTVSTGNLAVSRGSIILMTNVGGTGSRIRGTGTVTIGDGNGNGALSLDVAQTNGLITRPIILNGGKIITAGIAQIDSAITLNAANAANLIETPFNLTLAGALGGPGRITKTGVNTLTLTNVNTYSGSTTISGGTLTIGGAGQLGSGMYLGNITNNAAFIYASSATQTLSGDISGGGTLAKTSTGTLILSGTNFYTGGTTISAGQLVMGNFQAVRASGTTTVGAGGAFDMHGYSALSQAPVWVSAFNNLVIGGAGPDGNGALLNSTGMVGNVAAGGYTWNRNHGQNNAIYLTTNALFNLASDFGQLGAAYTNTYLNLNNYTLTKSGAGSYYLCNTLVSNGNLTIIGGAVVLDKSNAATGSRIQGAGMLTIGDGHGNGTLSLDVGQTTGLITRPITLNGGKITTAGIAQIDSTITLNATNAANTVDTPFTLTLTGTLGGAGGLTKTGAGTLVLTNATSTYTGDTVISNGTLEVVMAGNATLSDSSSVRLEAGGKLKLSSGVTEKVKYLYLSGVRMWIGTWGSTSSSATHKNDTYFAPGSSGVLDVQSGPGGTLMRVL